MSETTNELTPILHLLCTVQVVNDEIDNVKNDTRFKYFKHDLKRATTMYLQALKPCNKMLRDIWDKMPDEEFDSFIELKRDIIRKMQHGSFEDMNEMHALYHDAQRKTKMLDMIEVILNTHVVDELMRNMYRSQMGYTKEQYQLLINQK